MAGYLLIGLTLAAAIIGTLSETNRWIKSGLICIAVMASVAAGWLQFEAEAEAKLDRTLIASLVQSLQNDRVFSEEIRIASNTALSNVRSQVSTLTFSDSGLSIGITNPNNAFLGIIHIGQKQLRPVRYALISETNLVGILEDRLLHDVWDTELISNNWNEIAPTIAAIMSASINALSPYEEAWIETEFPQGNSVRVSTAHPLDSAKTIVIELTKEDIGAMVGLPPIERGRVVYQDTGEAYIAQL